MARLDPGASARWMARRAKLAASSLKSEYDAGKRGDESPTVPIFPTPKEQLDALLGLARTTPVVDGEAATAGADAEAEATDLREPTGASILDDGGEAVDAIDAVDPDTVENDVTEVAGPDAVEIDAVENDAVERTVDDPDVAEVAGALRGVDWQQVKAVTGERTGDAARAMRTMAEQVDWAKVQPVAAQVSSALIAAVAAGRIPMVGPLGPLIARALTDRGALTQRIGQSLVDRDEPLPPDFRPSLEPPEPS